MIATLSPERRTRALEFGIYRDGDNNLDDIQSIVLDQAIEVSAKQPSIEFTVEDTDMVDTEDTLSTQSYRLDDGQEFSFKESPMHDMSSRANLAQFVARTLDNAEKSGAKETWIDLVDHGAGDGGGLEADHAPADDDQFGPKHVFQRPNIVAELLAPLRPRQVAAFAGGSRHEFLRRLAVQLQVAELRRHNHPVIAER